MSVYDQVEATFKQENRKLKAVIAIALLISTFSTIISFSHRYYFIHQGVSIFEERLLSEEICRLGVQSIAEGSPNPHVVTDAIIKLLEKNPFDLTIDKILKLESVERHKCKIIFKSGDSLLAFNIGLDKSFLYPFEYKLMQIDETQVKGIN